MAPGVATPIGNNAQHRGEATQSETSPADRMVIQLMIRCLSGCEDAIDTKRG